MIIPQTPKSLPVKYTKHIYLVQERYEKSWRSSLSTSLARVFQCKWKCARIYNHHLVRKNAGTVSPLISIRSEMHGRSFFADDLRCVVPFGNSQSGSLSLHYCINILLPIIYTSRWEITYSAPTKEAKCWLLPGHIDI